MMNIKIEKSDKMGDIVLKPIHLIIAAVVVLALVHQNAGLERNRHAEAAESRISRNEDRYIDLLGGG